MTKHLRFLFVMLLAMIWSAGWAAETVYKTLSFPDDNQANNEVQSYSSPWTAKIGSDSWSIVNFNNNNWGWNNIRCGRKKYASVATITNSNAFGKPITKVVVNASDISNLAKVKSIKLETSKVANFSSIEETVKLATIKAGYLTFEIKNPIENGFYKLTFDCLATANGFVQVDQVDYYIDDSKTSTTISFGSNSNKTFIFTEGKLEGFSAPTATETNNVKGTIKYSSNNESAVKVDASTGALSFPGYGEATITATFTPTDTETYAVSTDSYKVINNQKVDESVIVFSAEAKSFESIVNGKDGYDGNKGKIDFIATNGKKYTFDVQRALKNNGKLQLNKSTVTSPAFPDFTNGYKVTIEYNSTNESATIDLSSGAISVKGKYNDKTILLDVQDGSPFKIVVNAKPLYISKIEIVPNNVILDETATNNTIGAKTGVNVTLKRSMVANEWNTICLPFDVTEKQAKAAFGDEVKIVELDTEAAVDANVLSFKASTVITAATPYLIKPSAVSETGTYTFDGVDITETNDKYAYSFNNVTNPIAFKGIFNMVDITKDVDNVGASYYAAFLGDGNKIYKAGTGKTKGFRAYFAIPNSASASALRVVIDGTATSIKNIDSEVVESNAPVYNLQGQRVDGNNLTPGIYVKAGKKFVIK